MRFEAVLVRPLDEQTDRDGHKIDPKGVAITGEEIPIWRDFKYDIETDLYGKGVVYYENGALVVRGELYPSARKFVIEGEAKLAIGIKVDKETLHKAADSVIEQSSLMSIGMTWEHQDPAQPAIRLLDDWQD